VTEAKHFSVEHAAAAAACPNNDLAPATQCTNEVIIEAQDTQSQGLGLRQRCVAAPVDSTGAHAATMMAPAAALREESKLRLSPSAAVAPMESKRKMTMHGSKLLPAVCVNAVPVGPQGDGLASARLLLLLAICFNVLVVFFARP